MPPSARSRPTCCRARPGCAGCRRRRRRRPPGYYYPALIAHPVQITNFREIYNDHIAAHVMAFVLAFARGLHHYVPQQLSREWKKLPQDSGVIHLPEATALVVGVGGIGSEVARLAAAFGMRVIGVDERRRDAPPGVAELHRGDELDALLPAQIL